MNEWMLDALCAQTGGNWFADETPAGNSPEIREAIQICRLCAVQTQCLEYALVNDERYGIWGGISAKARKSIRTRRNLPPPPPPEDWHGTAAGAKRHYRRNETPCGDCLRAARTTRRDYRNETSS